VQRVPTGPDEALALDALFGSDPAWGPHDTNLRKLAELNATEFNNVRPAYAPRVGFQTILNRRSAFRHGSRTGVDLAPAVLPGIVQHAYNFSKQLLEISCSR
jgi:hypothetical protein